MMRSRVTLLVIVLLVLCLVAVAAACTQQDSPGPGSSPTAQATDMPAPTPTLEPTDRSVPPPDVPPTDTPTPAPTIGATHTPEAVPTPEAVDTPEALPTAHATDTPATYVPPECIGVYVTNTPDPNVPESRRNWGSQSWTVSTLEEAECITGYPIAVPAWLPDGFVRSENIFVNQPPFPNSPRFVQQFWHDSGDAAYGFNLEQNPGQIGLSGGDPATINGIPGERSFHPADSNRPNPLLSLAWRVGEYTYFLTAFLHGPVTEEVLLEVAASLELRDAASATHATTVSQACSALDPTSTPDPNRPEGILGSISEFWNVSSFEEAECITDYPIAIPTNLPDGFIRGENIIVNKRGTSHFEDRWVEHGWYIPGDPPYGFRLSQHSWKLGLGNGEPAMINGIPGERHLLPAQSPDFQPLLSFLWEEGGYWYTIDGYLDGPITEEFLLEVAASLRLPEERSG